MQEHPVVIVVIVVMVPDDEVDEGSQTPMPLHIPPAHGAPRLLNGYWHIVPLGLHVPLS
jgi:hypothetical protein